MQTTKIENIKQDKYEVAQFSKTPRSNLLIEVLRIIALILLIMIHFKHMGLIMNSTFLQGICKWSSSQFDVFVFIAITGIFTTGKGKDYFLRNLSRLVFVIIAISAIFLPLFFTTDMNLVKGKLSWETALYGGRDGWYLWVITACSIFFPFIKIDKFVLRNKSFSTIAVIVAFIIANTFRLLYGNAPFTILWVLIFGLSAHVMWILYCDWKWSKKGISLKLITIVIFAISSVISWFLNGAIAPISMTLVVMVCATTNIKTPRWFNQVVRNSYFIYETHFIYQSIYAMWLKDHYHQFGYQFNGQHFDNVYFTTAKQFWECYGFVLGTSLTTSIILTQLQINVWERFVAKNILYIHKPFSKAWWVILGFFIVLYWIQYII